MATFDIIMLNMSSYAEWQKGVSNRNYHILRELVASEKVGTILAVDYPPLTLKRAARSYMETIVPSLKNGAVIDRSLTDKVTKLSDRLFVYSGSNFFAAPRKYLERVKRAAVLAGLGDFVVWSYYPPIMPLTRGMGQALTVFDAVDNWSEHSSYVGFKDRMIECYQYVKKQADVIFTVSEDLQALFDNQPNVYWVPNGVDIAHYQDRRIVVNRDIADIPRPIIGYIGVVEKRVDVDLIVYVAKKNPHKSFVIVGPVWNAEDMKSFKTMPNIYVLGYKSYDQAPAYIQQFDVALIPHRASSFITSTNPMKLYEYLACGKPVVATKEAGAEQFKDLVYIANGREDFNRKIFTALQEDSDERRSARRAAVQSYSWNAIAGQMIETVSKKLSE